jgi:uncharacterized DUF497 family protein
MKIEFDQKKSAKNVIDRGLGFSLVDGFKFEDAITHEDARKAYSEPRYVSIGYIGERLHVTCYCLIEGGIRVISLRKANTREVKGYEKAVNE